MFDTIRRAIGIIPPMVEPRPLPNPLRRSAQPIVDEMDKSARALLDQAYRQRDHYRQENRRNSTRRFELDNALREIIAMETPGANATVKRMAARARLALGELK